MEVGIENWFGGCFDFMLKKYNKGYMKKMKNKFYLHLFYLNFKIQPTNQRDYHLNKGRKEVSTHNFQLDPSLCHYHPKEKNKKKNDNYDDKFDGRFGMRY